ncbi:hypothetical protein [Hymenobacter wooponensis]|uniref:Uncharacterized protein n=1 Tax=Hymenobacter wooponensis TaxID=1525360 RepID=A0A4Z0MTA3_9BACT|nr:hypothetical protein [Hymenobacter wooponensis]TGD82921.1 hypothetical protein EU557_03845 [Hymenobacter wooponensis]
MKFNQNQYLAEMTTMVNKAIERMQREYPEWEIYTISIWTDPGAEFSAISFDSKIHSDKCIEHYNQLMKSYQDAYLAKQEYEKAKQYAPVDGRNDNPADFELRDFEETNHTCFAIDWEDETEEDVWDLLEPAILKVGEYTFHKAQVLNRHTEFELGVNGVSDWYETTWHTENSSNSLP